MKFIYETNKNAKISINLFVKPTDRHQHTRRSIVFNQALRVSRICSYESEFVRHLGKMKV